MSAYRIKVKDNTKLNGFSTMYVYAMTPLAAMLEAELHFPFANHEFVEIA